MDHDSPESIKGAIISIIPWGRNERSFVVGGLVASAETERSGSAMRHNIL
jgi:hypothetical protein